MNLSTLTTCYIGLGSNQGNSLHCLQSALQTLDQAEHTHLVRVSSFYRSKPVGPQDQPDFVNAVAELDTQLDANAFLQHLLSVEQQHGRVRDPNKRWGPRTLDLDLLLYGDAIIETDTLSVPHPYLQERSFVVYPLFELIGDARLPNGEQLGHFRKQLGGNDLKIIPTA